MKEEPRGAAAEPVPSAAQVARKTRAGVVWTVGTGLVTRGIGLVTTLLLTRYMSPDEAGEANVALTLITTVAVMTTVGLGQYLASQRQPSARVAWNAMMLHVTLGAIGFVVALVLRYPLSRMFGAGDAGRFIPLLVLTFMLERVSFVPERVLVAHMRFGQLSVMRSAGELSYCAGAVAAAMLGYGPWCIVAGNFARQLVRFVMTFVYARPGEWFVAEGANRDVMLGMVRFGLPVMVASIAVFATRRWDNLLVAHYYGTDVLGLYNLAYNLAEVPATQIAEMVGEVLAPSFARLEAPDRRKSAVDMIGALALTVFPLAVGLGLVAPTLAKMLPRRWEGMEPYLVGLSVLSLTRPAGMVLAVYLQALRKPLPAAVLQISQVALLLASLSLVGKLLPYRPVAVTYAVGFTFTVGSLAALMLLRVIDEVPAWPLLRAQLLPTPALLSMALCVRLCDFAIARIGLSPRPALQLAVEIAAGGAGYLGGALIFIPGPARRLLRSVRSFRKK